jgi:pyruvate formate lyase activating enzyme
MNGIVFDIQHYAIYDGPGIRTTVFLKGCLLRCVWCQNPESQRRTPDVSYFRERCADCGACVEVCPGDALELTEEGVHREAELCKVCGSCIQACPNQARDLIGRRLTVPEIVEVVSRDKPFYDNSGGGVTISGGEPTFQPDFLLALLRALRKEGVHTAVETCGFFREQVLEPLIDLVDLFLYDLKHMDPAVHKQFTAVSNELILSNFTEILSRVGSDRIVPRVPIIPGFNSDPESFDALTEFLRSVGYSGPVHLMPYNKLAKTKYEKVGMGTAYRDMGDLTTEQLEAIVARVEGASFPVVCNH